MTIVDFVIPNELNQTLQFITSNMIKDKKPTNQDTINYNSNTTSWCSYAHWKIYYSNIQLFPTQSSNNQYHQIVFVVLSNQCPQGFKLLHSVKQSIEIHFPMIQGLDSLKEIQTEIDNMQQTLNSTTSETRQVLAPQPPTVPKAKQQQSGMSRTSKLKQQVNKENQYPTSHSQNINIQSEYPKDTTTNISNNTVTVPKLNINVPSAVYGTVTEE